MKATMCRRARRPASPRKRQAEAILEQLAARDTETAERIRGTIVRRLARLRKAVASSRGMPRDAAARERVQMLLDGIDLARAEVDYMPTGEA